MFKNEFDLDPKLLYLNGGSHSICPRVVIQAVQARLQAFELNPTEGLFSTWNELWKVQTDLGEFLGADPRDLFLRHNITEAMNTFILGVPLPKGAEILTTDLEYGAIVNLCRYRAERDGCTLRVMSLPATPEECEGLTEDKIVQKIVAAFRPETKMLMISHIMTSTGLKIPLQKLAKETRSRGVILAVDGAHAPGAIPLDFRTLGDVDFYGGNLHKWMMGPKGTAFGWVHPRHQDSLALIYAGWTTFEMTGPFSGFGGGRPFQGRMLISSSRDYSGFFAIQETLAFWRRLGPENIFKTLRDYQSLAEKELAAATGWKRLSPEQSLRGPLVTFEMPERLRSEGWGLMARLLKDHHLQIVTAPVRGKLQMRLSPHIWNTPEDIHRAAQIIGSL